MMYSYTEKKRIRKSFGKTSDVIQTPNLIDLQINSYNEFLGMLDGNFDLKKSGLHKVFESVFPIYTIQITVNLNIQALNLINLNLLKKSAGSVAKHIQYQ